MLVKQTFIVISIRQLNCSDRLSKLFTLDLGNAMNLKKFHCLLLHTYEGALICVLGRFKYVSIIPTRIEHRIPCQDSNLPQLQTKRNDPL